MFRNIIKLSLLTAAVLLAIVKFGNDPWVDALRDSASSVFSNKIYNGLDDRPLGLKLEHHKTYLDSLRGQYDGQPPIPKMINITNGQFRLGCSGNWCREFDMVAGNIVEIQAFQIASTETTLEQWDMCVAMGGCNGHLPDNYGLGRGNFPAVNISYLDAKAYIDWLNSVTDGGFYIPNARETEYAARAGTSTLYPWGNENPTCEQVRAGSPHWKPIKDHQCQLQGTWEVDRGGTNAWGLYNVIGNVNEWTSTCGIPFMNYNALSFDTLERSEKDCGQMLFRGGAHTANINSLGFWYHRTYPKTSRLNRTGVRIARKLKSNSDAQ